jgi:hypothetical protein
VASSLLNTGRQVGGSIGLAVLGTVAWTVFANTARHQAAAAGRTTAALRAAAYQHALAAGFDRAFLVAAGIAVLMLVAAISVIRVRAVTWPAADRAPQTGFVAGPAWGCPSAPGRASWRR